MIWAVVSNASDTTGPLVITDYNMQDGTIFIGSEIYQPSKHFRNAYINL